MNIQQYLIRGKSKDFDSLYKKIIEFGWVVQYDNKGVYVTTKNPNPELSLKLPKMSITKDGLAQVLWALYGKPEELAALLGFLQQNSFVFTPLGFDKKLPGFLIFDLEHKW